MTDAGAPSATRVVLCDDAVGFPDLVALWVDTADGFELAARTSSEAELLAALREAAADAVLLDFMLPEGPTDAARVGRIRELAPGARIVLVSSLPAMQLEDEAERVGADGWCPKATTAGELLAALSGAPRA